MRTSLCLVAVTALAAFPTHAAAAAAADVRAAEQLSHGVAMVVAFGDAVVPGWREHNKAAVEKGEGLGRQRRSTCNLLFDLIGNSKLMSSGTALFQPTCK